METIGWDYAAESLLCDDGRFQWWRGRRTRTGAAVLLKRSRKPAAGDADAAALRREAAALAALSSAARLQPRCIERGHETLLMLEDPGGVPLSALRADGRPALPLVLAIGTRLAATLAELHARGLVHQGLRPDAVLCDRATGDVWLIDAAEAGPASATAEPALPMTAARLAHAAPEQTGRTAHGVDARSDLYALGLLLYELLAGAPPLRSDDPLELLHWQLAGVAPAPASLHADIPQAVSDLVMRLLAKTPGERYQSAAGVEHDLVHCARAWSEHGRIDPFRLGRRDAATRLSLSSRLYGRDAEVAQLRGAFERCCGGRPALLLVGGSAGIGKTALVQQLVKPIVRERGTFIGGKFDQLVQGIPFGAPIQAFRALVQQLLTESEPRLAAWRDTLGAALGAHGGVLAEVIPEIEFIVGAQPAPQALGPVETQNRFQRVFHDFVAALATPAHPLVLFLDDLQWADAATLSLLEPLLASSEIGALLVIGTCRDNELGPTHRLTRTLATLEARGLDVQRLTLGALGLAELTRLIGDALRGSPADALPLARLVEARTGGNPFFVVQFLKMLERDGHFRFDDTRGCWTCDIDAIAQAPLADNVIELMTRNLQRLAPRSQYALTLAACIGSRFDTATLATVSEQPRAAAEQDLAPAIAAGLLLPAQPGPDGAAAAPAYDFLHDRVQQAAYALIPEARRRMVHLTVGRLLHAGATPEQVDTRLFDIVHHLNLGSALIHDEAERLGLARLNLAAGRRAKASTAHEAARTLLRSGLGLLDERHWQSDPALAFALHLETAESEYLCGRFDAAEPLFTQLLARAADPQDRARVARMRSVQYENMGRYHDALASALHSLALLGVTFPDTAHGKQAALEREIEAVDARLAGRDIALLVDLPPMRDERMRVVMSTLTDIWSAAFIVGDPTLARLFSATMVRLSLEHGNVDESAYGYVTHAITVGPLRGDYARAYAFGRLALAVNQRLGDTRRRAKVYQQFHAHVSLWCEPWPECLAYAREACRAGLASGDFLYGAYGAGTEPWTAIAATQDLRQFEHDYAPTVSLLEKLRNGGFADSVKLILNWSRALRGRTAAPLSLSDASLDERAYQATYRDNPFFATIHGLCRLHLCCLLGSAEQALEAARGAGDAARHLPGTVWPLLQAYWQALAWARADPESGLDVRAAALAEITRARALYETLAGHCAYNFRAQALLLAAEGARLERRHDAARAAYEQAIEFAAANGLLQHQALACERAARHRLERGERRLADLLMAESHRCYAAWGAAAKVEALEQEFPELAAAAAATAGAGRAPQEPIAGPTDARPNDPAAGLDLVSLLKAGQALAGEMVLDRLVARLLHIAIENAGAERGCLVLEGDAGPVVHSSDALAEGVPLEQAGDVPAGIVNYVRRTGDSVVLADAPSDDRHGADPYIERHRPRSVSCVPVQQLGRLVGVLYLENGAIGGAFGAERIRVMQVLASVAASALQNARLVAGLEQEIGERRQAQERLAAALAEVQRLQHDLEAENRHLRRDLIANVSHDLRTPLVSLRGYLEVLDRKSDTLPEQQRQSYLQIALRQSERLSALIDELFELAKLDFKGVQIQPEAFPLEELANDVLQKFQLAAQARQVALELDAAPALPFVCADLGLIERVLDNLIGNALQHTGTGGRVALQILAADGGAALRVRVADTGCGIAPEHLPHVFDRHWRGAPGRGGAGLGLAITRRILELHHGTIDVESEPGRGACFTFELTAQLPAPA